MKNNFDRCYIVTVTAKRDTRLSDVAVYRNLKTALDEIYNTSVGKVQLMWSIRGTAHMYEDDDFYYQIAEANLV